VISLTQYGDSRPKKVAALKQRNPPHGGLPDWQAKFQAQLFFLIISVTTGTVIV
jgi:hypothetical protein